MAFSFKKKKATLRKSEIDQAIKRLKMLYKKYADLYGTKLFNLRAFEDRYLNALRNKTDINLFLHTEISIFEELKKRVIRSSELENSISSKESEVSYSDIADRIIEENLARIKKYRYVDFHPDAEVETKYLLGAVTDYYYNYWSRVKKIIRNQNNQALNSQLEKLENDFSYYVLPIRGQYSRAVDDYQFVLARKNPGDNEKASVNFIKYGGILLNNCEKLMRDTYNSIEAKGESSREEISELKRCISALENIILDFRLKDIRSY